MSDWANKKAGIRGRVFSMWLIQSIEAVFCIIMGFITVGMDRPDEPGFSAMKQQGVYESGTQTFVINGTAGEVGKCASELIRAPATGLVDGVETTFPVAVDTLIMIKDPGTTCVHNGGTLGLTMLVMICFSLCVQMAEGLHYGIVPYVSRVALGVCSGMVGAGGNAGAVIANSIFFTGDFRTDVGIIGMGAMIIGVTALMFFV